jgi:amidase
MTEICPAPDLAGLLDTLQSRVGLMRLWQQFLDRYPVLICPVSAELPFPDQLDVESPAAFRRVFEAQLTQVALPFLGLPGLTVSTALIGKIPVGVQLIGGRYREDTLFAAGTIIEAGGSPPSPIDP